MHLQPSKPQPPCPIPRHTLLSRCLHQKLVVPPQREQEREWWQWFCILYPLILPVDKWPSSSHLEFSRCARTCKTLTNANRLDLSQTDDSRLWMSSVFRGSSSPTCSPMLEIALRRDNSFHSQLQKPLKALNELTQWFRPVHWSEKLDDTMGTWKMGMKWQIRVTVKSKRAFLASLGT